MKILILHLEGARKGESQEVAGSQAVLGRDPGCHVAFDAELDGEASLEHTLLTVKGTGIIVSDLGSRNGTFLNGQPLPGPTFVPEGAAVVQCGERGPKVRVQLFRDAPTRIFKPPPPLARIAHGGHTDTGPTRKENQDHLLAAPPLFVVTDGCGGHKGGQVASRLAANTVLGCMTDPAKAAEALRLVGETALSQREHEIAAFVRLANRRVFDQGRADPELLGMGTTLTLAWFTGAELVVANVGDSRTYRLRRGELVQLTEDDSLVAQLVKDELISKEEAAQHPDKNVLLRSIGMKADVEVSTLVLAPEAGDVYALCSDGVHGAIADADLARLAQDRDVAAAARRIVELASERSGHDNATVLLVRVVAAS